MLQRRERVSYRPERRQFALDETYLEDLKGAILFAYLRSPMRQVGPVWIGGRERHTPPGA